MIRFCRPFLVLATLVFACGESKTDRRHREELEAAKRSAEEKTNETIRNLQNGRFDPEEFSSLEIGMSYDRASAHLGGPGEETATAVDGATVSKTYQWGGGAISATFVDGKLTAKSKR